MSGWRRCRQCLERKTERAALMLRRRILGPIVDGTGQTGESAEALLPCPDGNLDVLAIVEPDPEAPEASDTGSNVLRKWRRGESNPRPKAIHNGFSVRSLSVLVSPQELPLRQDFPRPARWSFRPRPTGVGQGLSRFATSGSGPTGSSRSDARRA